MKTEVFAMWNSVSGQKDEIRSTKCWYRQSENKILWWRH